jgi:hypothetical protein
MATAKLYLATDNVVTLAGLRDEISGDYQNTATCTGLLYTAANDSVGNSTFALTHVVGDATGTYRGQLPYSLTVTLAAGLYTVEVLAVVGTNHATFRTAVESAYLGS